MKFVLFLLSTFLANNIKAELLSKPEVAIIPREQDSSYDSRKDDSNAINEPPKQVIQTVMEAVQDNMISKENFTDHEVPEVIVSEPEREINDQPMMNMRLLPQQQQGLPLLRPSNQVFQRVYKLPSVTRMISSEEEPERENSVLRDVKIPQWRSPLPFMHNHCIHSMNGNNNMNMGKIVPMYPRRLQLTHKRAHRHHKHFLPIMAIREPMVDPIPPIFLNQYPIIKRFEQPIDTLPKPAMIMTILRRNLEPEPQMQPFNSENQVSPHSSLFISLMRPRPKIQENKQLPNPFASLLSKLLSIPTKDSLGFGKYAKPEEKHQKQNINYNFNVNFTVNNNNYYKDQKSDNAMQERVEFNRFNRENSFHRYPESLSFPNLIPSLEKILNGGKF